MSGRKKKKKQSIEDRQTHLRRDAIIRNSTDISSQSTTNSGNIPLWKNLFVFFALVFIINYASNHVTGYKWVKDNLIKGNLDKIKKFKDITYDQKYEMYFRADAKLLQYIRDNTPDTAIILMPPDTVVFPSNNDTEFNYNQTNQSIMDKTWSWYFVYPRRLVYDFEKETNPLYKQATHVAIVNYWGYDKLSYQVAQYQKHNVLPLRVGD